jgi:hypothetical protein
MDRRMPHGHTPSMIAAAGMIALCCASSSASATDEIQVYNAGIAELGQVTVQQHLNYVPLGVKNPPLPVGWCRTAA